MCSCRRWRARGGLEWQQHEKESGLFPSIRWCDHRDGGMLSSSQAVHQSSCTDSLPCLHHTSVQLTGLGSAVDAQVIVKQHVFWIGCPTKAVNFIWWGWWLGNLHVSRPGDSRALSLHERLCFAWELLVCWWRLREKRSDWGVHVVLGNKYSPKLLSGVHGFQLSLSQYPGSLCCSREESVPPWSILSHSKTGVNERWDLLLYSLAYLCALTIEGIQK